MAQQGHGIAICLGSLHESRHCLRQAQRQLDDLPCHGSDGSVFLILGRELPAAVLAQPNTPQAERLGAPHALADSTGRFAIGTSRRPSSCHVITSRDTQEAWIYKGALLRRSSTCGTERTADGHSAVRSRLEPSPQPYSISATPAWPSSIEKRESGVYASALSSEVLLTHEPSFFSFFSFFFLFYIEYIYIRVAVGAIHSRVVARKAQGVHPK